MKIPHILTGKQLISKAHSQINKAEVRQVNFTNEKYSSLSTDKAQSDELSLREWGIKHYDSPMYFVWKTNWMKPYLVKCKISNASNFKKLHYLPLTIYCICLYL